MKSSEYWRQREEQHIAQMIKDEKQMQKAIADRFQIAIDNINKEIDANWQRFANKEGITLSEAKKISMEHDVKAFARKAKQYVKDKDFSKTANEELRLYNVTMRVNRLELLKSQIGLELVALSDDLDKYTADMLTKEGLAEAVRQAGILGETVFSGYKDFVDSVVNASFHSATFSQRIWGNMEAFKADLDKLLVQTVTQGKNPRDMARKLRNLYDSKKYEAERLMRTESARVQTAIQEKGYKEYGIEEYEFIAEPNACPICAALNGKIFKVKDMSPGINACPMHANCRCSTAPHVDRLEKANPKTVANELLESAKNAERAITNDLVEISKVLGTDLAGLDFRLKTLDSLTRKVSKEPDSVMRDVVRYTTISSPENMVKDMEAFIAELDKRGYTVSAVKNYWNNLENPYNGINANFLTPEKYEFELQFHTKESFDLKNGPLHEVYEKFRVLDPLSSEAAKLKNEMDQLSKSLERPQNIDKVKGV